MEIQVENVLCKVLFQNELEKAVLEKALTVTNNKWDYALGVQKERTYFRYHLGTFYFMSGLLSYVLGVVERNCLSVNLYDNRTKPDFKPVVEVSTKTFRPYTDQAAIVDAMLKEPRGVLDLATNYGKTKMMAEFWHRVNFSSMLIIVPTRTLLYQTSSDIEKCYGLPEGTIGRVGDSCYDWKPITVAIANSVDKWIQSGKSLPQFSSLFIDEGHRGTSDRYMRIAFACDAFYRFWLSGTAYKDGERHFEWDITSIAGPCLAKVTNKQLVEAGRSVRPHVYFIDVNIADPTVNLMEYASQYKALKTNPQRNDAIALVASTAYELGLTVVTFVEHKSDHLRLLRERMGHFTEFVTGNTSSKQNKRIKQGLIDGSIRSVIATSTWREGVSIPRIDVLNYGCGRKAPHFNKQYFGRLLRMAPGKTRCFYFDYTDKGLRYPYNHSTQRQRMFQNEGFLPEVITPEQVGVVLNGQA